MERPNLIRCMVRILLCGIFLLSSTSAQLPEYISVCGRKNPDLSNCINASVIALEPYLRNGIAELKIPPVEPLNIEKVNLLDTNELKAIASDLQIWGLLNYHLNHLNVDFDKREIKIELSLPELKLIANYDVNIKLINAPIMSKGVIELLTKDVDSKILLKFNVVNKKGKEYMFFSSMSLKLDIKDYDANFKSSTMQSEVVRQAVRSVLGGNKQEVINTIIPNLEEIVSKTVLNLANRITKQHTYDEIFPDRE